MYYDFPVTESEKVLSYEDKKLIFNDIMQLYYESGNVVKVYYKDLYTFTNVIDFDNDVYTHIQDINDPDLIAKLIYKKISVIINTLIFFKIIIDSSLGVAVG